MATTLKDLLLYRLKPLKSEESSYLTRPLNFLIFEFELFVRASWRDWNASIIPAAFTAIEPIVCSVLEGNGLSALYTFLQLTVHIALYLYFFNVENQINGVEEDLLNKPDRPIPSEMVTLESMKGRRHIVTSAYLLHGYATGGWPLLALDLLWVFNTWLHEFGSKHWTTKCLFILVGIISLLCPVIVLYSPIAPNYDIYRAGRWVLLLSVVLWFGSNMQDFRDAEGDKAAGRITLVTRYFPDTARGLQILYNMATIPICYRFLILSLRTNVTDSLAWRSVLTCNLISAALLGWVSLRLWIWRTPRADHDTYFLYCYWFCFVCMAPTLVSTDIFGTVLNFFSLASPYH
jgi:4-hydroxybenzoate polyprenyltransferase